MSTVTQTLPYGYMGVVRSAIAGNEAAMWQGKTDLELDLRISAIEKFLQPQGFVASQNPNVDVTQTKGGRDPWSTQTMYNWTMSNPFNPSGHPYSWTTLQ
jgi:hypothetical protein